MHALPDALQAVKELEDLDTMPREPEVHKYLHSRLEAFDTDTLYELHYMMITLGKVGQVGVGRRGPSFVPVAFSFVWGWLILARCGSGRSFQGVEYHSCCILPGVAAVHFDGCLRQGRYTDRFAFQDCCPCSASVAAAQVPPQILTWYFRLR